MHRRLRIGGSIGAAAAHQSSIDAQRSVGLRFETKHRQQRPFEVIVGGLLSSCSRLASVSIPSVGDLWRAHARGDFRGHNRTTGQQQLGVVSRRLALRQSRAPSSLFHFGEKSTMDLPQIHMPARAQGIIFEPLPAIVLSLRV